MLFSCKSDSTIISVLSFPSVSQWFMNKRSKEKIIDVVRKVLNTFLWINKGKWIKNWCQKDRWMDKPVIKLNFKILRQKCFLKNSKTLISPPRETKVLQSMKVANVSFDCFPWERKVSKTMKLVTFWLPFCFYWRQKEGDDITFMSQREIIIDLTSGDSKIQMTLPYDLSVPCYENLFAL